MRLSTRLALGCQYDEWLRTVGKASRAPLRDFLQVTRVEMKRFVPKKEKQLLRRCLALWRARQEANGSLGACIATGYRRPCVAVGMTPEHTLLRRRGLQGMGL